MAKKDFIPKASNIFGNAPIIDKQFSNIEDIKIEVIETSEPKTEDTLKTEKFQNLKQTYGKSVSEFIDCHNKFCYSGGFSIGIIIREMASKKLEVKEGSEVCQGYEGSAKGARKYRSCTHCFYYCIEIKYKKNHVSQTA